MILLHDDPDMLTLCFSCTGQHMATHGGTVDPLTPAQLEEIAEWHNGGEL